MRDEEVGFLHSDLLLLAYIFACTYILVQQLRIAPFAMLTRRIPIGTQQPLAALNSQIENLPFPYNGGLHSSAFHNLEGS